MHPELHRFLARLVGVALMALMPLAFIAFVSMPFNLSRHPGEAAPHVTAPLMQHMT
jgi:uncharacterized membrane protein (DUF4010 family)